MKYEHRSDLKDKLGGKISSKTLKKSKDAARKAIQQKIKNAK